ncbi:MAG: VanZ family protein [Burkholderiaceae bacterium]
MHPAARPGGAGWWLAAYVGAIIYATLYPLSGWRTPGAWMFGFLTDPWPRWWTRTDVTLNVIGYLPIGLLLAVWLARRLRLSMLVAALLATIGATLLSLTLECLQVLLPERVPSWLDLIANSAGGAIGALLAALLGRRRIEAWPQALRDAAPLAPNATPGLVLLSAWLLAQLYPQPMVFATGDLLAGWPVLPGRPEAGWLAPLRLPYHYEPFAEAASVALTVLAIGLLGRELLLPRVRGPAWPVALPIIAAMLIKTAASAGFLGQDRALAWLTAGAQGGLVAGVILLGLVGWMRRRARLWLTIGAIAAATLLYNLALPNAYYLSMRAGWNQGVWVNFHGLLLGLAAIWPFAALAWCFWRLRDERRRSTAPPMGRGL